MATAKLFFLAILATLTASIHAQIMDPMGTMRKMTSSISALLDMPDVKKELKLDKGQNKKIDELLKAHDKYVSDSGKRMQASGNNFAVMQKEFKDSEAELDATDTAIEAELNDEQKARLQQIRWQAQGTAAIYDPKLQDQLALTEEQTTKIGEYRAGESQRMMQLVQNGGRNAGAKLKEMKKKDLEYLMGILTKEQKDKLKAALGPECKAAKRLAGAGM